uniref:Uncharacterized protein n=1 Tax=Arundo donax TaxID=35708 RepID=A0A0A9HS84_ARUDO
MDQFSISKFTKLYNYAPQIQVFPKRSESEKQFANKFSKNNMALNISTFVRAAYMNA